MLKTEKCEFRVEIVEKMKCQRKNVSLYISLQDTTTSCAQTNCVSSFSIALIFWARNRGNETDFDLSCS